MSKVTIAEAVGTASGGDVRPGVSVEGSTSLGALVQARMATAIQKAYKDGHADNPAAVREYMDAARLSAREAWRKAQAKAG